MAGGQLNREELAGPRVHYREVRLRPMGCEGIGPRADCGALFALHRLYAFPVEGSVKRALRRCYVPCGTPSDQEPVAWARQTLGPYAGDANRLLVPAEREAARTGR